MRILKKIKYKSAILLLFLIVAACMSIDEIIHPENPQVNSEIEIKVKIKLVPETDDVTQLVFAVLAPKSWNVGKNAKLTLSTAGYPGGDLSNEEMVLMTDQETEPSTALKWSAAFQSKIGLMDNLGPVEWVVFRSQTTLNINDKVSTAPIIGNIKIKLTTGSQNMKMFMGYVFCGKNNGFGNDRYKENAKSKVMTVTGGAGPMVDYTTVSLVSTVPSVFGYGDIFSIKLETVVGDVETPLMGADKVYIYGKAIYNGGKVAIVDEISAKTLMEKVGENSWQRYLYPKYFFNLPADAEISETYFHFRNEDKSKFVKTEDDGDFLVAESRE